MSSPSDASGITQVSSGIPGLDELLRGGICQGRMYLAAGGPGTGKTTLGYHFLEEGLRRDETVLYIHSEESQQEILDNAGEFGIEVSEAEFLDLGPDSGFFTEDPAYDLVSSSEIEEQRYTQSIYNAVTEIDPARVVLDPITQLRYVESSEHHYRKRLLSFMRFLKEREITILATATTDRDRQSDREIRSLSDGVIELSRQNDGRRIEIEKNRGIGQVDGDHGLEVRAWGLEVFPRVIPQPNDLEFDPTPLSSGIDTLDELLGGGFERGTVTFVSGPPGVGKTTIGTQYLIQSASAGRHSVIYLFEEREETLIHRSRSLGMPIDEVLADESLTLEVIDPLALSSEEFAHHVRHQVEAEDAELVMIDGFGGYTTAIQGTEEELKRELHALTRYLGHNEVTTFVTDSIHEVTGISSATSRNISPIADNILFLSYVESQGALHKVVGVLKKRAGGFEHTLRKFEITSDGLQVRDSMRTYSGILRGTPQLLEQAEDDAEP